MISRAADIGRIIGASAVFYFHIGIVTGYPLSPWGEYAVSFFIVLSGFAYAAFSSVKPTDSPSYLRYISARIRAILPLMLAINCLIFSASFFYPSRLGRPFTFTEFLFSAAGLSQYFDHRYLSLVMWFIPFIIQAYLVFPFIDAALNRLPAAFIVFFAFTLSLLLTALVFSFSPLRATDICRNWSVVFRLPEVCIGVIVGRSVLRTGGLRGGLVAIASYAIFSFVLATALSSRFLPAAYILSLPWNGLIVASAITAVSTAVAAISGNLSGKRLLRLIGSASFPFFLTHGVAIVFVFRRFGDRAMAWIIYFLFCWSAAILLTIVFNRAGRLIQPKP